MSHTPATIALCYGTRPQVVKASMLSRAFRRRWHVIAIDTGQHYDYELNELLYHQLEVRQPDHLLGVGSDLPARQIAKVLERTGALLESCRPELAVVVGDTNSTLGCALAASTLDIPVVHVEAGLRSAEANLPEEVNRRVVDVLARVLCAPSEAARVQLVAEQCPGRAVLTGDVARDVLNQYLRMAPPPRGREPFVLATAHRAALTTDPSLLAAVFAGLGTLDCPVMFPMHPRTRAALERYNLLGQIPSNLVLSGPLGYLETVAAVRDAAAVVTDSGGLQREAYWLGTPCLTLRHETEWTETLEAGANVLLPPQEAPARLRTVLERQRQRRADAPWQPDAYGDGRAVSKVAEAISEFLGDSGRAHSEPEQGG